MPAAVLCTEDHTGAWPPTDMPFMTGVQMFDALAGGKLRNTAHVLPWTWVDGERHMKMGCHAGWGSATDPQAALVATP